MNSDMIRLEFAVATFRKAQDSHSTDAIGAKQPSQSVFHKLSERVSQEQYWTLQYAMSCQVLVSYA